MPVSKKKPERYTPSSIEPKWQKTWDTNQIYKAADTGKGEAWYSLVEFPYPSGDGLHVGHVRSYTAMDVISRKRRMQGYRVLLPMGWDAFGLPAENYAIKTGIHPAVVTKKNTQTFKKQLQRLGFSFDWQREIDTTDPAYYRWTQWMFTRFFNAGLAYKASSFINWCPNDKVGLANEEVVAGACERCGTPVEQKEKEQWMIRITAYAEQLLEGLQSVDFLPEIKKQQENWIGKKTGIEITYPIVGHDATVTVFTTRPETNFGATFVAIAPTHALIEQITTKEQEKAVKAYVKKAIAKKANADRVVDRKKTGVFTGAYARNHLTKKKMPIYISDFVLDEVGTGALVGVPGHDLRDFEFAQAFAIPVVRVVIGKDGDTKKITRPEQVQEEAGTLVNSGFLDGVDIHEGTKRMMDHLEQQGWGKRTVSYHLRDWVFSRQRYWGEPIPMINCTDCGWVPVPDDQLPVTLPKVKEYAPGKDGESPLASIEKWIKVRCPECHAWARRETDVMPQWAGSSWYFLRYTDPHNTKAFASRKKMEAWMPVNWYNGGMEHVTLHLLYSRFWNRFLYDQGYVPQPEPYVKRTAQGMVLGAGGKKMSKSKGNVINPDSVVASHGADTLRTYEMFMGPFDQAIPWDPQSIEGVHRFLSRVYSVGMHSEISTKVKNEALVRAAKRAMKKVSDDIETMSFNTAIAALMIFMNEVGKEEKIPQPAWEVFLKALAPFAPHLAEELWQMLDKKTSIHRARWPEISEADIAETTVHIAVQINGKTRDEVIVPVGATQADVEKAARKGEKVQKALAQTTPKRVIYVPGRIINFVI